MVQERQAQRLARGRLFEEEIGPGRGQGGRPGHLVVDPVAHLLGRDRAGQPARDAVPARPRAHRAEAVTQAQIGAHPTPHDPLLHAEDVRRGSAEIHGHDPAARLLRQQIQRGAERRRRGQHRRLAEALQTRIAGRAGHDVVQEDVVDAGAHRLQALLLERRP